MSQSGTKSVNEFIQHVFAFDQMILCIGDFLGQLIQELGLNTAERFSGTMTRFCQIWICRV